MSSNAASAKPVSRTIGSVVIAVVALGTALSAQAELQLGLRLDSASSMQWKGGRIYVEGPGRGVVDTSVARVDAVWPGSTRGSFVVFSDQGIGVLFGTDIVSAGPVLEPGALIRSSRIDALWFALPAKSGDGSVETRFVEWRGPQKSRELARITGSIIDFDVDATGRLLYLTAGRRIFLLAGADRPPAEVVLPAGPSQPPERVFIDAQGTQIVVYGGGTLSRFATGTRQWSDVTFDVRRHALVRHATSRRVAVEDKFVP